MICLQASDVSEQKSDNQMREKHPLTYDAISRAHIFDPTSSLESGRVSQTH